MNKANELQTCVLNINKLVSTIKTSKSKFNKYVEENNKEQMLVCFDDIRTLKQNLDVLVTIKIKLIDDLFITLNKMNDPDDNMNVHNSETTLRKKKTSRKIKKTPKKTPKKTSGKLARLEKEQQSHETNIKHINELKEIRQQRINDGVLIECEINDPSSTYIYKRLNDEDVITYCQFLKYLNTFEMMISPISFNSTLALLYNNVTNDQLYDDIKIYYNMIESNVLFNSVCTHCANINNSINVKMFNIIKTEYVFDEYKTESIKRIMKFVENNNDVKKIIDDDDIYKLVNESSINFNDEKNIILSVVDFKSDWYYPFIRSKTQLSFTCKDSTIKKVSSISRNYTKTYHYIDSEIDMIEIQFTNRKYNIGIIIPTNIEYISKNYLHHIDDLKTQNISIVMPRFTVLQKHDILSILHKFNIDCTKKSTPFNISKFTQICQLTIDEASRDIKRTALGKHQTSEGTEKEESYDDEIESKSSLELDAMMTERYDFIANRTFQFYIRDMYNQTILFQGIYDGI